MSKVITKNCKYCSKVAKSRSFFTLDDVEYVSLECGHTTIIEKGEQADYSDFMSEDGRSLYPFQVDGCKFAETANFNCLIADEMGLGKTVQALALLKKHEKLLPCLILTKTSLKHQWFAEVVRWTGLIPQIIEGKDKPSDFFKVFILSIDLLKNVDFENWNLSTVIIDECQSIKNISSKRTHFVRQLVSRQFTRKRVDNPNLPKRERIQVIAQDLMKYHGIWGRYKLNFERLKDNVLGLTESHCTKEGIIEGKITISRFHAENDDENSVIETILHEIAHAITPGAGHRKIWSDTSLAIGGDGKEKAFCDGTIEPKKVFQDKMNVIALSGTPIKNKIDEYFPILNILRPDIFYSDANFKRNWVGSYFDGRKTKSGKLVNPEEFKRKTKDFIIRRERKEVLPDLPKINRTFHYTELAVQAEKHYKALVGEFVDYVDRVDGKVAGRNSGETLAFLTKMRHATGRAKIDPVVDFVDDFLYDTDRSLTIFVHHKDVGSELLTKLTTICQKNDTHIPLMLTSDLTSDERGQVISRFKNGISRIMIASTLASGEGLNLQFCSDCIMVERQWNPANEEQAEGRFSRIGSLAESISATYMTAIGTIDEFFMKLVENKRKLINEAMTGNKVSWDQDEILSELSSMIVSHGRKAWNF